MKKVLITGATGLLGQKLLEKCKQQEFQVMIASRKAPQNLLPHHQWEFFDLSAPNFDLNLLQVDTIMHLASSTKQYSFTIDVDGTKKLLQLAKKNQVRHFIYISIVGVGLLPVKYFKIKYEVEKAIQQAGVPYTILRATQFFEFFEEEVKKYQKLPLAIVPGGILYQPIEVDLVAKKLLEIAHKTPQNVILELGGSEKILLKDALKQWLECKHKKRFILNIPLFLLGKIGRLLANGVLTTEISQAESAPWKTWLQHKYSP